MNKEMTVSPEEELKLRKSFEFGAYLLITHYLSKNYGINELERFARFWAETGASADRRNLVAKSKQDFLEFEAKIEKAWVGRKVEKLDVEGYVGIVEKCPIRLMSNQHREGLPSDYFCDHICSIIYPHAYKLLGFRSSIEKLNEGCRLVIQC
ncbi:MAG: hypothetical protein ABSB28_03230 [Candidatus Bathyarchaeia archaeon]